MIPISLYLNLAPSRKLTILKYTTAVAENDLLVVCPTTYEGANVLSPTMLVCGLPNCRPGLTQSTSLQQHRVPGKIYIVN
jgi:hypothetical protein